MVDALAAVLKDGDVQVRQAAADALGYIGPPAARARPALQEALQGPDADDFHWCLKRAVKAIGR